MSLEFNHFPLLCPVCHALLQRNERAFSCRQLHSFDVAREGHVNLLQTKRKRKVMGDTKEMLRARRAFLEKDYYYLLSDGINRWIGDHIGEQVTKTKHREEQDQRKKCSETRWMDKGMKPDNVFHIVDIGCGEGYYLGRLSNFLAQTYPDVLIRYCGVDLAKDAARYAAKRYTHLAQTSSLVCREVVDDRFSKQTDQQMLFIVADVTKRLLFPTAGQQTHEYRGIDIVLNISAPRNPQEFARVMAHGGLLIIVIPMPDHLAQLRSEFGLLNIEEAKREKIVVQLERDFQLAKSRVIRSTVELKTVDLHNLIHMTPNHWHLSNKIQSQIESKPQFTTTFNFEMLQFRKI